MIVTIIFRDSLQGQVLRGPGGTEPPKYEMGETSSPISHTIRNIAKLFQRITTHNVKITVLRIQKVKKGSSDLIETWKEGLKDNIL